MSENTIAFSGSIPEIYDQLLGEFVFEPFAVDLAGRVDYVKEREVLELACGTGRLTKHVAAKIHPGSRFTVSDLQEDMLTIARKLVPATNITWSLIDMQQMNLHDKSFDLVLSQFGLMLAPDRGRALNEIHRVLKPGGRLLFSVWGDIGENEVWDLGGRVVGSFIGDDPFRRDPGPFTMNDSETVMEMMKKAGFSDVGVTAVKQTGTTQDAASAARGFVRGLPIYMIIRKKDPELIEKTETAMAEEFKTQLGDQPLTSRLSALVFEGIR